jgi:hypothetical protein
MKLCHSSTHRPFDLPENLGIDSVERLLVDLQDEGVVVEVVETAAMPESERPAAYFDAATVAVRSHVGVRRVFGTNRVSGTAFFGREVPALLVYGGDGVLPVGVVPYERDGTIVTIRDYLAGLVLPANVS